MPTIILGNTMYDLTEAAALLGVNRRTCHQYILDGKIAAKKIGKKWMLNEAAINDFLQGESAQLPINSNHGSSKNAGGVKMDTEIMALFQKLTDDDKQFIISLADALVTKHMQENNV